MGRRASHTTARTSAKAKIVARIEIVRQSKNPSALLNYKEHLWAHTFPATGSDSLVNIERFYKFLDVAYRFLHGNVPSFLDDFDQLPLFSGDVIQI
jgi:hypothetical protein